jgi:hypothetical protein
MMSEERKTYTLKDMVVFPVGYSEYDKRRGLPVKATIHQFADDCDKGIAELEHGKFEAIRSGGVWYASLSNPVTD